MSRSTLTLVGDGIENPWNAVTLRDCASMFDASMVFRDTGGLAEGWQESFPGQPLPDCITLESLEGRFGSRVALDNLPGAESIYGFRVPGWGPAALIVGNERRGLSRAAQAIGTHSVEIPLVSRQLNCLNVAAAAAVGLYYISRGGGGRLHTTAHPDNRRPDLLLLGAADHVELGSAIRSAGAFGWQRVLVEDRARVWFGCDRAKQTEGRAAARRARNPIHLVPTSSAWAPVYDEVCVVSAGRGGTSLTRAQLARGPGQLLVIPDESAVDLAAEEWGRMGKSVRFRSLDLEIRPSQYHYRLMATIALAEVARQVGQRSRPTRRQREAPFYDRSFAVIPPEGAEVVMLEDLREY